MHFVGKIMHFLKAQSQAKFPFLAISRITLQCLAKKTRLFGKSPYKMVTFSQGFWALKVLQLSWPPGSKQCDIGGFQKGTTCPCALRGCKVTGYQKFSTWKKLKVFIGGSVFTWQYDVWKEKCNFWKLKKVWQPAILQPLEAHGLYVLCLWNGLALM